MAPHQIREANPRGPVATSYPPEGQYDAESQRAGPAVDTSSALATRQRATYRAQTQVGIRTGGLTIASVIPDYQTGDRKATSRSRRLSRRGTSRVIAFASAGAPGRAIAMPRLR